MSHRSTLIHLLSLLIAKLLPMLLLCFLFWQFHQTVLALARDDGSINPYLRMLASMHYVRSFAFLLGILGVLYGLQQRGLRRRAVARLAQQVKELEAGRTPGESR